MAPAVFQRGHRMFTIASAVTMLIGVLHTTGLANDPPNDAWVAALDAAKAATLDAGPISMSFYGVYISVWIQVGVLLVMLGLGNILVISVAAAESSRNLARALSMFDAAFYLALTVLFVYFQIPPPLISFALLTILLGLAAWLSKTPKPIATATGVH